jgi:hypothetical protein
VKKLTSLARRFRRDFIRFLGRFGEQYRDEKLCASVDVVAARRQRRQVDRFARSAPIATRNSSATIIRSPLARKTTLGMSRGINDAG